MILTSLPNEILVLIFDHVKLEGRMTLLDTCRRLRHVCLKSSAWSVVTFPRFEKESRVASILNNANEKSDEASSQEHINAIACFPQQKARFVARKLLRLLSCVNVPVKKLIFTSMYEWLTDTECELIPISILEGIEHMDLSNTRVSAKGLLRLFGENPSSAVKHPRYTRLIHIALENLSSVTDQILFRIAQTCPHLVHISLTTPQSNISNLGLVRFLGKLASHHDSTTTKLENIRLAGVHQMGDSCLSTIARVCPNLKELDCAGAFSVGDEGVRHVLFNCRHLVRLSLSYCWRLSDDAFYVLGREHDASSAKEESSHETWICGEKLQSIELQFCYQLSDRVVTYISRLNHCLIVNLSQCAFITDAAKDSLREKNIYVV